MSYILAVSTILHLVCSVAGSPTSSLWDVDIFRDPAPSPEKGPPFSKNANRDSSRLKYELTGIGAAYIAWLLLTIILIVCLRRKLRRRAVRDQVWHKMELEKPMASVSFGPRSPGRLSGVKSWANLNNRASHRSTHTMSSIDHEVVELDKIRNMDEMASLYAAVIAHDEDKPQRNTTSTVSEVKQPSPAGRSARSFSVGLPSSPRDHHPTQFFPLATPKSPDHPPYRSLQVPSTPRSFVQPPHSFVQPAPMSPQYPTHWIDQQTPMATQFPPELQHLRDAGVLPAGPPSQTSLPLLSPAYYPPQQDDGRRSENSTWSSASTLKPMTVSSSASPNGGVNRTGSSNSTKPRPGQMNLRSQTTSPPYGSEQQGFSPIAEEPGSGRFTPIMTPVAHRMGVRGSQESGESQVPILPTGNASTMNSSRALPFRQYYSSGMTSAPPTKTTFVDRKESSSKPPRTGVPATPYSAYTPFTPMTPITPRRLVTKQEMKKKRKEASRGPNGGDDMVADPQDMWGDG